VPPTGSPAPSAASWPRDRLLRWGLRAWAGVGIVLLAQLLAGLLGHLQVLLVPLLVAGVIVYLLAPVVAALQRRGLPRAAGTALCYLAGLAVLGGAGLLLAPLLVAQAEAALEALPGDLEEAERQLEDLAARFGAEVDLELGDGDVQAWLVDNREAILGSLTGLGSVTASVLSALAVALVGVVTSFYVLVDLPRLGRSCLALVPPARREPTVRIAGEVSGTVGGFLRGQLLVALFVGTAATFAMWLIGLPLWLLVGVVAGVTNIVPFVGPLVGGAVAVLIALANGEPWLALWAAVAIAVIQQVESQVVSPLVMGRTVRLHPAVIVLAILLGGSVAGLIGLLVAVPLAASVRVLFRHAWQHESAYADDRDELPEQDQEDEEDQADGPAGGDADRVREFRRPCEPVPAGRGGDHQPGGHEQGTTHEQEDP
jgi:predicted PurR-regulated permease PerM